MHADIARDIAVPEIVACEQAYSLKDRNYMGAAHTVNRRDTIMFRFKDARLILITYFANCN